MKAFKLLTLAIAGLSTAILPFSAMAQSIVAIKDVEGTVFIRGLAPGAPAQTTFSNVETTRTLVSNACGGVIITGSGQQPIPASLRVGGTTVDVVNLPVNLLPQCIAGAWQIAPTSNFKTPDSRVVIVGQAANTAVPIVYTGDRVRSVTANACGQVRLRSSNSFTVGGSFQLGNQTFDVATLPVKFPPLCRTGVTYLPQE